MILSLWAITVLVGVGLLFLIATKLWQRRKVLGEAAMALFLLSIVLSIVVGFPVLVTTMLVCAQSWFVLLGARLSFGRLDEAFLRASTSISVAIGFGILALSFLATSFLRVVESEFVLALLVVLCGVVATVFLFQILWTFRRFRLPKPALSLKQLPTISVCIPARNEGHELTECIAAVLRSDYPKLEVIVLDDCSQDKTAAIIKSFAHDGVRFVQGQTPATGWLGKNQAMQTMAEHASGQWLLFMSVDTLLGRGSLTQLIHYALAEHMRMVSVLPQNYQSLGANTLFGTLQYYWQIALPITKRRVPVSGKCWLIKAETLKDLGGFGSVKHKIIPEGSFARRLFGENTYRFFVSDLRLGITTSKSRKEQIRTSLRLLYPTFKRQPFFMLLGLLGLGFLFLPFAMIFVAGLAGNIIVMVLSGVAAWLLLLGYALVLQRTHPGTWALGFLCLPFGLIQEAFLCLASMLSYEFSEVNWKGRNVCYPVISGGQRSKPLPAESPH